MNKKLSIYSFFIFPSVFHWFHTVLDINHPELRLLFKRSKTSHLFKILFAFLWCMTELDEIINISFKSNFFLSYFFYVFPLKKHIFYRCMSFLWTIHLCVHMMMICFISYNSFTNIDICLTFDLPTAVIYYPSIILYFNVHDIQYR